MKYPLFLLLLTLPALAARADDAVKLNCPPRGAITVSFFDYYLITMKWGITSGRLRQIASHTKAGVPFWTTTFGNGDDLAYFPNSHQYYLFYAGSRDPVQCSEQESYVYPVITPPRYENNIVSSKKSAPQTPNSEIDNSQVILPGSGAQDNPSPNRGAAC